MKKLISSVLIFSLCFTYSLEAIADCDFSKEIEKLPDGRFVYSNSCHKKVGKMVQDLEDRQKQVELLGNSIQLKDLALQTSDKRAELWQNTSFKLEDRMNAVESNKSFNNWMYFGLGILATGVAVYGASQLKR